MFRFDSVALAVQNVLETQTMGKWWDKNLHEKWSKLPDDGSKIPSLFKLFEKESD
jgi:hypothetical protein